jgi:multiple sugar transport system ATP-binding protein
MRGVARVVIEHLSKTFLAPGGRNVGAVNDLSLAIAESELLVVAGPSGCGKTTTLRLIAGLEAADAGWISMDGRDITRVAPSDRDLAMVFQNHALYPHMTARKNMSFGLKVRKVSKEETARRIEQTSGMLRIEDCLDRLPADLSGGQRQRVALGRALVLQPKLLLLDEPLSNLDAPLRAEMRAELLRLHKQLQFTMIYVTHDHLEAMTLGQRIAVMRGGRLEQIDEPLTAYRKPANRFVAGFFGTPPMNFFMGRIVQVAGEWAFERDSEGGGVTAVPVSFVSGIDRFEGKHVLMGVRPENIQVHTEERPGSSLEVELDLVESFGHETWLHLISAGQRFIARAQLREHCPQPGRAWASFDATMMHLFDPATGETIK